MALIKDHFWRYIDDSDFVVLKAHEFQELRRKSDVKPEPISELENKNGVIAHVVLLGDDYQDLIENHPPTDFHFFLKMPEKKVLAEAWVSCDPDESWINIESRRSLGECGLGLRQGQFRSNR